MLPGERVRLHAAYAEALDRDPGLAGGRGRPAAPRLPTTGTRPSTCRGRCPPRSTRPGTRWPRTRPPRRCATWNGRWRSGPGSPTRSSAPAWTGSRSAGWPAKPPTGRGRWTGLGRCSPTPWPSFPPTPTRSARRCCSSGTRSSSGTRAPPTKPPRSLQQALGLLPAGETTRAHAALLATLADALMRNDDMEGCAEAARRAIAAARACGATGAEADASVTLGAAMAYLGTVDAGLDVLRFGLRLALETAATEGLVHRAARLREPLRRARAARPARRGRAGGCRRAQAGRTGRARLARSAAT